MRPLSSIAQAQLDALIAYYESLDRAQAIRNLMSAVRAVSGRIEAGGGAGLVAPPAYPHLAQLDLGFRWLKQGSYWFAFTPPPDMTIAGVFYETANIPGRVLRGAIGGETSGLDGDDG